MRRLLFAVALTLPVVACGSPAPAVSVAPLPSTTAATRPSAPSKRGPSRAIASAFAVSAPKLVAYVDFDGLARTKLVSGLLPAVVAMAKGKTDARTAQCLEALPPALEEIALGKNDDGWLLVARYDEGHAAARSCFDSLAPKDAIVATVATGVVALGTRALVEQATHGGGSAPRGLELGADEYARFRDDEKPIHVEGSLALSDARFAFRADADLPEELARAIATGFQKQGTDIASTPMPGMTDAEQKLALRLVRASTLTRKGSHLAYRFVLDEGVTDQARDIGMASALAIDGVRKYLLRSKEAEAKNTVSMLARDVAESWEREQLPPVPRKKRRLRSFPPVPKTVPSGVPYLSSPADWAPWAPLKFAMDTPQRYQYEVRAARDGMSADVIARGDLNGDGKTSLFVIHVTVNKADRTLVLSDLAETDPDE